MKKLDFIDIIIALSVVAITALAVFLLSLFKINPLSFISLPSISLQGSQARYSPDILFLSSPVTTITGKVDKITSDSLRITGQYSYGGDTKNISFEVKTNKDTKITKSSDATTDYIFITSDAVHVPITLNDIKKSDMVIVSTPSDIRTVLDNRITADSISLVKSTSR